MDGNLALPEPGTPAGREGLAALIAAPARALIGLDFDGTLSPIIEDPAAARAAPETSAVLGRLAQVAGTVAIISLWIFGALTLGWIGYDHWGRPS